MPTLLWLQTQLPFLQSEWFPTVYGMVLFLNPLALVPQLIASIRTKPTELRGVSILMFIIFLMIQAALLFGAINNSDIALFWSMAISVAVTFTIIVVTVVRRK